MAVFRFKLQTLMDVALQRERSVQQELAQAQAAEIAARRQLEATTRLWMEWETRIRDQQRGALNAHLLRDLVRSVESLRQRALRERENVRAAERAVEAVRERLTDAARARKSLERLREKSLDEFNREDLARQVKLADDMISLRSAAKAQAASPSLVTGVPA